LILKKVVNFKFTKAEDARDKLNGLPLIKKPICLSKYELDYKKDKINSLLIKNIPKNVSSRQFYELCKGFGEVRKCKLELDFYRKPKGYGYVSLLNGNEIAKEGLKVWNFLSRNLGMKLAILSLGKPGIT
jgi:hypothetical protein